ncbi:hypothetical protein PHJA_001793100 [Phtheirospermum japonicum]|uniref:Uncharacterized protein n=1 Tax=Phtheirospermum japonicum TaxID=374723 RepID=A0A830CA67_9LAMI|nr:hypothetical protein PHJA_001793100 [Phtheirospermum japonicum]
MFQSEESAIYKWSETEELISEDSLESHLYDFPLSVSCNILALTLDAALQHKHEGVVSGSTLSNGCSAKVFAGNILWDFSNLTLQMLSQSLEHRSSAVRFLLPLIFKAFAQESSYKVAVPGVPLVLTRNDFFMKIWKCCKLLFSMGSLERRDAYSILTLYLCFSSQTDETGDVNVGGRVETFDLRVDQEFWDEIKRGLLDKESLLRKQSLHILKTTLNLSNERKSNSCIPEEISHERGSNSRAMGKRGRWADKEAQSLGIGKTCNHHELSFNGWEAFVFLYELLEEFGTHLVEAAWSHQIMLWLRSLENPAIINEELYHNRMATAEQTFEWLAILWERGFFHDNPQVRSLIMHSFLAFEWENYGGCIKLVPKDFILGPLILGLNDPVHHKEFGVKEVYSSWATEAAARFLGQYVSYMERRQHIAFLIDLSIVPKTHSFGRAGLMCLVECIASAACAVLRDNNHENKQFMDVVTDELVVESAPNSCQIKKADLLDVLRFVLECSKRHFNTKYRHQVCLKITTAAASVMTGIDIPLNILLHFISSLPREYTDYGGSLRYVVQNWLRSPDFGILKAINDFPRNFISYQHPVDLLITYDDEELETWVSEAKRWARVLFLVVEDREHFGSILKFVEDHGADVCKLKNSLERVAVKFLILVSSMIDELQVIQGRAAMHRVTGRMNRVFVSPSVVDNLSFSEESIIFDKLVTVLFSFLEELVSFTKLSCSVFWSGVVTEDMALPGSIKGKLGGPSQRRLSSSLCTSVLEAITAIKTLASLLRMGAQFRRDGLTNSAQIFLWSFCWKIITTPAPKSEVEAEICVAAYEACAFALKDLVSVFSPLSMGLVANNDNLISLEADGKALDVFVSTFIHNINNVIEEGSLARTRRAILMNWKWICVESLLSLPNYALCNGVDLHMCKLYFSDTTVKQIFGDLVGSLENAGEVSVLSMLRSVRFSMELFDLKRMDQSISSSDGITIEMMWAVGSFFMDIACQLQQKEGGSYCCTFILCLALFSVLGCFFSF